MIVSVRKRRAPSRTTRTLAPQPQPPAQSPPALGEEQLAVTFPDGLLGLPNCRRFVLTRYRPEDGSVSPFLLLQCQDEDISLPLIDPRLLVSDYHFAVAADVRAYLKAATDEELATLAVVTVRDRMEDITMNLQGPLVMNMTSHLGLQLVVERFPVRYPLFVAADDERAAVK